MSSSTEKLDLPAFLKLLTSQNVSPSKAMIAASKIYKTHNTPSALVQLTDTTLKSLGLQDKDDRKTLLAAIRKANLPDARASSSEGVPPKLGDVASVGSAAFPSPSKPKLKANSPLKKRKREDFLNKPLPDRPPDEGDTYGNSDFGEVLDVEVLKKKSTVVNRAPIMTAWAMVVAERMGFQREEALSIATVYTEMNAISKGLSLGIYHHQTEKGKNKEAAPSGAQPYVDLMGRRIPLYRANINSETTQWRALSASDPVPPSSAYKYITSSLRQTTPFVIGALRLLAQSYGPVELNNKGFGLYADFRPDVEGGQKGWGMRGEVKCQTILALMKKGVSSVSLPADVRDVVKTEDTLDEPHTKKPRVLALEEYEAAFDDDPGFGDMDLESIP